MIPRVLATSLRRQHRFGPSSQHLSTFCFTLAAILYSRPVHTFAHPALPRRRRPKDDKNCPFYGCPLLPTDVHYSSDAIKSVLESLRELKAGQVNDTVFSNDTIQWNRRDAACLTLIGYKGGPLLSQINQDRAVVISPYYLHNDTTGDGYQDERILMGVFDGHANRGEVVSDYTVKQLPEVLAKRLLDIPPLTEPQSRQAATVQALQDTFVQLDKLVPAHPSGGCTASVVMKQDSKVYIANAGDSRSFVVVYRPSTKVAEVVYISREDKPSLADEKARVEAMGGQVYIPMRGTSRVVYQDPISGAPTGLAMSRSIGDWEAGKMGVIPDPIVDVLDLNHLVVAALSGKHEKEQCFVVDEQGDIDEAACSSAALEALKSQDDDVYVFAVSASDGVMDFLEASEVAKIVAPSLFDDEGSHPVTACELLIFAAANAWQSSKQGRYRDDIAIAVTALRSPPSRSAAQ
jgi:serine/threonine protein phosphatase PrpC